MNLAYQDICNGAGICIIDPRGDLVKQLVHWIPEERVNDTLYLDLKNPVPMDLLSYDNDDEREALVGEIKYLVTQGEPIDHAPLMRSVLDDLINTILNHNENVPPEKRATFLDICNFLESEHGRKRILQHVSNDRWKHKWDKMPNDRTVISITSRLTPFVNSRSLRTLFGCPNPKLNIQDIMDGRKILLVDLGGITEPKKMLGTLLIAKMRQVIFRRESIPPSKRIPFYLFVDEFQYFQTSDFPDILSFAGGYGLRLALAHQFTGQLNETIRKSIFGNVANFVIFCLGPDDAPHFKHLFPPQEKNPRRDMLMRKVKTIAEWEEKYNKGYANDSPVAARRNAEKWEAIRELNDIPVPPDSISYDSLMRLAPHEAVYKIGQNPPVRKFTPKPFGSSAASYAETIRKRTIHTYACDTPAPWSNTGPDDNQSPKPDDIGAGKPPNVPPHGDKKKNP